MNELEKRAKVHQSKQDGLSPFCSLGENYDGEENQTFQENLGSDYSQEPEINTLDFVGEPGPGLPGFSNKKFKAALDKVGIPYFKIRTTRLKGVSYADLKDEFGGTGMRPWTFFKDWDSSVKGFNEFYFFKLRANEELTESTLVVDFNFTKELMYEVEKYLYNNPDTRRLSGELDIINNHTFGILIENGDWKHEHLYLDHVVSQYLSAKGLDFEYFTKQVGTSDSDCYSAWHYYDIEGSDDPMLYDVEGDDAAAAKGAQEVANTLSTPVKCRGVVYYPQLELLSESKRKKPYDSINTDAGNVEHNIEMFNHMSSPVEGPCNNPVSGPFGGSVGESLSEGVADNEQIELNYDDLEIEVCSRARNPGGYYDRNFGNYIPDDDETTEVRIDYVYTIDRVSVEEVLGKICLAQELTPEQLALPDDEVDKLVDDLIDNHFDELFTRYESDILDHWREYAKKEAEEKHYYTYYESYKHCEDLMSGEEVFMERYDVCESEDDIEEPTLTDYFKLMNDEDYE